MKCVWVSIMFLMAVVITPANAQQQKGDKELGATALIIIIPDADYSMGIIQGKYGYYFTDRIQGGVSPLLSITPDVTTFGAGVFGTYSFLMSDAKKVPYVGAQFLAPDFGNFDMSALGLQAGLKIFLTERVTFDSNINYLISMSEGSGVILISSGLGFIWR